LGEEPTYQARRVDKEVHFARTGCFQVDLVALHSPRSKKKKKVESFFSTTTVEKHISNSSLAEWMALSKNFAAHGDKKHYGKVHTP
jgi:hypothetical protein